MFRALFYGLIFFFVWRIIRSLFPAGPADSGPRVDNRQGNEPENKSSINIDKKNIDDASFKDID